MCYVTHSCIDINISEAYVRITKEDKNGNSSSTINLNENKDEEVFQAANFILKVHRFARTKLAQEVLTFPTSITFTKIDYQDVLRNIKS